MKAGPKSGVSEGQQAFSYFFLHNIYCNDRDKLAYYGNMKAKIVPVAWIITLLVTGLAIAAWAGGFDWNFSGFSLYQLFPIFGLLAFSLMWAHYMTSWLRRIYQVDSAILQPYFTITGWAVLLAILLHPGLLEYQLWRDGFGLPPGSVLDHYVAPALGWVAILGFINLIIFLIFELHRFYGNRRWWRFVRYATDLAMLAAFYHGLRLGTNLQAGWFQKLWWFYGVTLIIAIAYNHWWDHRHGAIPEEV
jgi:hypothetical protein